LTVVFLIVRVLDFQDNYSKSSDYCPAIDNCTIVEIRRNHIEDCYTTGILVRTVTDLVLISNTVKNPGLYGYNVDNCDNVRIAFNFTNQYGEAGFFICNSKWNY